MSNYGLILDRSGKIPGIKHRADAMFCGQREIDLLQGFSGFIVTPSMFPERAYEIKDCPDEAISCLLYTSADSARAELSTISSPS